MLQFRAGRILFRVQESNTILRQYFTLQLKILKRQLAGQGINAAWAFGIGLAAFYGLSYYLFTRIGYANWLYVAIALSIVFKHSEAGRNDFLKFTFRGNSYYKIRILENLATAAAFIIFLLVKKEWNAAFVLSSASVLLSFIYSTRKTALTIPTPFYKKPFEFIVGFRVWFGAFFLAYFLVAMSAIYQNFNLGIFALLLVFLVCFSFYNNPENEYFVWIHRLKARPFLFDKIKTAIVFSTILALPIISVLLYVFRTDTIVIIGFLALGYCYLVTMILAKYSAYPQSMSLPQAILLALSLMMPPMLFFVAPYFYSKSIKQLKQFLNDKN